MARTIPYDRMTEKKWASLGETMTLKKACDLWWNCILLRVKKDVFCCYKCSDKTYDVGDLQDALGISEKEALKLRIKLNEDFDYDSDYCPVVYATIVK